MDENILLWEEDEVLEFLSALGYPGYSDQIRAEGITGELLIHCNHEALKDIGIHSVGHRLAILKAVYQLKLQWDVPVEEGHWVPPSEGMDQIMVDSPSGVIPPDRMLELLRERDERILSLEMSISRLQEHMTGVRDEVHVISKTLYTKDGPPVSLNRLRGQPSPTQHTFPHPLSNSSIASSAGGGASAAASGVLPASSVALKHMRSGSLSASASGSGHSPQLSPVNSPTRYQHTLSASQPEESVLSASAPQSGSGSGSSGLQHSSSLRRQRSQNRHAPPPAPANPNDQQAASSSPAPSPLPSSMLLGTNGSHEPSTPTAYQGLPVSSAGDTTPSMHHHPPHQYASAHVQHSPGQAQVPAAGLTMPSSAELPISGGGSNSSRSARPSTGALSTSPSGGAGSTSGFTSSSLLSERPATASTSTSLSVGHGRDGTAASSSSRDGRPSTTASASGAASKSASGSGSSADNPLKSFRVTYNDPCWKVLPAALKKYKINDDWRQYALFICYGTVERCLAYDEKPLLLFQKLTETNQKPVFMLRHIKDIASPVAAALAKHARKRDKRAKEGKSVLVGEGKEGPIRDFTRATRLHQPTVLMPVKTHGKSATSPGAANPAAAEGEKGASTDKEKDAAADDKGASAAPGEGYAIAIYPYLADREDEFDVAVGDTFAILNKTKGWWVVHRDTGTGSENDVVRSGWVPQGCLLEITTLPPSTGTTPIPTSVPINPLSIVSVSAPGIALMDYTPRGSDELSMKKDDKLLVFKRYQFWSYVIKEATGERGWTPSWFVGKVASSAPSPSPLSAAVTGPGGNTSQTSTPTSALATGVSSTSNNGSGSTSVGMHTASLSATTPHSAFGSSSVNAPPSTAYTTASSGAGDTTPTSAATFASAKAYDV